VVQHLPGKDKELSSNPKKKKTTKKYPSKYQSSVLEVDSNPVHLEELRFFLFNTSLMHSTNVY
jgi:hypothetical protein